MGELGPRTRPGDVGRDRHTNDGERARPAAGRRLARSRILYISGTPLVPSKLGPARRNYHLVGQLSRFFDTFILAIGVPGDAETIRSAFKGQVSEVVVVPARYRNWLKVLYKTWRTATGRCDFLPVLEPEFRNACAQIIARESFQAIVLSSVFLRNLPLPDDAPIIGDTHNVEFDVYRRTALSADSVFRRFYAACQWPSTRRQERSCGVRVALLLATSARDGELFERELKLRSVAVVPNGIDLAEFHPAAAPSRAPIILFSGLMSYYPNQQGIRWFLDEVFPTVLCNVPDATLVIAGASPPKWLLARRNTHVQVTGRVSDMRPYIGAARVIIAPLMIGGGTRVKILEAQAMAKPVVSTSLGAEGLLQRHDESILIGDDARSFAVQVVRVLRDPTAAARIGANGWRHVVEHFDWDHIGVQLGRLLEARIGLWVQEAGLFNQERAKDARAHRLSSLQPDGAV
jgi:polysaccharide biosynthesis protein PslH